MQFAGDIEYGLLQSKACNDLFMSSSIETPDQE